MGTLHFLRFLHYIQNKGDYVMTEKSGTVKNGNGLKIPKTRAFEKRFDFYEQLWKDQVITKKITRTEYKEILDKLGPCVCRTCGKESEKKTDIGFRKTCKKCTEKSECWHFLTWLSTMAFALVIFATLKLM